MIRNMRLSAILPLAIAGFLAQAAFAQAPGMKSAVFPSMRDDKNCDRECLFGFMDGYLAALAARDPSAAPVADNVVFTENNVVLPIGEGLWRTIDKVRTGPDGQPNRMRAADPQTGYAAYFGTIEELGNPAFYTMLLKVENQAITQVQSIVVRLPDAPKPFGDVDNRHAPEWDQVLPEAERRPRERLQRIADGYFSTVELNDGQIFTHFAEDCGRLENGILTTSMGTGIANSQAAGCENQLKLGIYRINKRIRERRYRLIDEERGIVVATGFFDHANWFDQYTLNDGRSMNTALKWPNSISLIEAFRIRDGEIQRVEATFTYVPYSMHNPINVDEGEIAELPALGPAPGGASCDANCLTDLAKTYMDAMVDQDPTQVPWADQVHFAENGVKWWIGDAIWGTASAASDDALIVPDPQSGTVTWIGEVEEHGLPAYYAMTMDVRDKKIASVDSMVARERSPGVFILPNNYAPDATFTQSVAADARTPRARMADIVKGYYATMQGNDGTLFTDFTSECRRVSNGVADGTRIRTIGSGLRDAVQGCPLCGDRARSGTRDPGCRRGTRSSNRERPHRSTQGRDRDAPRPRPGRRGNRHRAEDPVPLLPRPHRGI